MAQTEALLLIGLGFVLALLLVFAFGQSFWSLAGRLAKRKQEKDLPSGLLTLKAERDSMRAEHAALVRRLEALEDTSRENAVMKDAEVARQRNRVLGLTENMNTKESELSEKAAEIAALTAQISELSQTLEIQRRASDELADELAAKDRAISDLHTEIEILRADVSERRSSFASSSEGRTSRTALKVKAVRDLSQPSVVHLPALETVSETEHPITDIFDQDAEQNRSGSLDNDTADPVEVVTPFSETTAPAAKRFDLDRSANNTNVEPINGLQPPARAEIAKSAARSVNAVIQEARKSLVEHATDINQAAATGEPGKPSSSVISLAKRLRALQAKSDEKIAKTLK
jgi:hypothetical protein